MRIERIEALLGDGRTLVVPALGEHFSLVVGNNEAGKSSLRRVVRDTLFPPPRPRGNQKKLRTEAGMIAVGTPFGPVQLFSPLQPPIGDPSAMGDLERTRGALSRFEFEQLYCLGIEELHVNRLLDEDQDLSVRLNALSTMGSFATRLRDLEHELEEEARSIYRPDRRGRVTLRELEKRFGDLETERRTRMSMIGRFSRDEREIETTKRDIAERRLQLRELRARQQLLDRVGVYRGTRTSSDPLEVRTGTLLGAPPYDLAMLERVSNLAEELALESKEVDDLVGRIEGSGRRLAEISDQLIGEEYFERLMVVVGNSAIESASQAFDAAQRRYEQVVTIAQGIMGDPFVGDDEVAQISREVLSPRHRGALEDLIDELDRLGERVHEAERNDQLAAERLAREEEQRNRVRAETDLSIAEQASRLIELEDRIRERAMGEGTRSSAFPRWSMLVGIVGVVALLGGLVRSASVLSGPSLAMIGLGGVCVIVAWVLAAMGRQGRPPAPSVEGSTTKAPDGAPVSDEEEAASLRASIAHHLGSGRSAGPIERTALRGLIEETRQRRDLLDRAVAAYEESLGDAQMSEDRLRGLRDELSECARTIESYFASWHTPASYEPLPPRRRLDLLSQLVQAGEEVARARVARDEAREALGVLRAEAETLLSDVGHLSAPVASDLETRELVGNLRSVLERQSDLRRERTQLSGRRVTDESELVGRREALMVKERLLSDLIGEVPAPWTQERIARLRRECQEARDYQSHVDGRSASILQQREDLLGALAEEELSRLEAMAAAEFDDVVRELQQEIDARDEEISQLERSLVALRARRDESRSTSITEIDSERSSIKARMVVEGERYLVASTALELLRQARTRYERETRPEVLDLASTLFERFTGGRYEEIDVADSGGKPVFVAVRAGGGHLDRVGVEELSRGTQGQLLLALRLAYLDKVIPDQGGMPIILDDVCVDFDLARTQEVIDGLLTYSESRQVIYLTCHERERSVVIDRAAHRGVGVAVVELLDAPVDR